MATLQTIRSKGPLLVIVIGLAIFAFIAGDAWNPMIRLVIITSVYAGFSPTSSGIGKSLPT